MSIVKSFRFPVSVHWLGGHVTRSSAPGKPDLDVATPPEFRGGVEGIWSPEELLVTATASCYAVTLAAIAERRDVPLRALDVRGVGHVEKRADGRFGFVAIELEVELGTDEESRQAAVEAARRAEELCIVAMALDVPVHVRLAVPASTGVAPGP